MSRLANSQFSFADWELLRQGVGLEPSLVAIADFLDEHEEIIEAIRRDLRCCLKRPDTGRKGLTAQQVLRSLILMRVKNWDYRELRERIADGLTLRRFMDFNAQPVPKHDAFQRAFTRLTPQTLKLVNELLVQAAVAMGLEDGSKLRVDTTVVATDIHHPTDNTLLWDVVRVVTRLVGRLADTIERPIKGFRNRTRAARRRMLAIQRMTTRQRQTQQRGKYRELIGIAEEVVEQARSGLRHTRKVRAKDVPSQLALEELRREIEHYCGRGERVVDQARRRVLQGGRVANDEKIYSIFEPYTDLIMRGKVRTPVEFGHKVFLSESAQGLITKYEVLNGNPLDENHVEPSLSRHECYRRCKSAHRWRCCEAENCATSHYLTGFQGDGWSGSSSALIGVGRLVLFAILSEQLHVVVRPDTIPQLIKQLDNGKGLLCGPVGRDCESDGERQAARGLVHDLAFRRWCARCSDRSRASLRR